MPTVTSRDGTRIAYESVGSGPPIILVDGALGYRDGFVMRPLARQLHDSFSVTIYDRRGRGESGDTKPYAPEREVEDIEALLQAVGGSAYLYGCSSGGALAMEAADRLPGIVKLVVYEVPVIVDASRPPLTDAQLQELQEHVAADRRGEVVKLFMRIVGVPGWMLLIMPLMRKTWTKLKGVGHTLPYDFAIVGPYQRGRPLPEGKWNGIKAKALVADGGKSPPWMRNSQQAIARNLGAEYRTLPGQTHMVNAEVHAAMIRDFCREPATGRRAA